MKNVILKNINKQKWGYFFIMPALIVFVIFVLIPFIQAGRMGFMEYTMTKSNYIGFKNYIDLFNDRAFQQSLINTLKFVFIVVPSVVVASILIALSVYDKSEKLKTLVRVAFYLPFIIPSVCLAVVWRWFYSLKFGLFNSVLDIFKIGPVNFLGNPNIAIYSLIVVVFTWALGQPVILYIASLGNIPKELHEAAEIDGANEFNKFHYITLPLLKPTTFYVVIILTISVIQVVEVIILISGGGPGGSTVTLLFLIYNYAFKLGSFGYAAAIGNIVFIVIFILSLLQYKLLGRDVYN